MISRTRSSARILIVARRTAASPELIAAVHRRAHDGPCTFTLLVPSSHPPLHLVGRRRHLADPEAERRIDAAVPLLARAARSDVVAVIGAYDPLLAVQEALTVLELDEVIVSMLPARSSVWLRQGLPSEIRALGVPVTEVIGLDAPGSGLAARLRYPGSPFPAA